MINFLNRFMRDDSGATMIEYALMVALISILCITAIGTVKTALTGVFTDVADKL